MFKSLDENSDGVLTMEEIKQGAEKCEFLGDKISSEELIQLFNEMDVDKNGLINYTEFVSALMDYGKYIKKEGLIDCFKNYDLDGNGTISLSEFMDMIRPQNQEEREKLEKLYTQFDTNGDGEIDFDEFVSGVMNSDDL
ncbi:MAG: EF-hand domain-containing protein [archaeon]|nr:EF-hand domain-containing protein [archaeon]